MANYAYLGWMKICVAGVAQGWMRAIRRAWVAAVLKPDRSIGAGQSLHCCSTAIQTASQGTLSPSPTDSRDPEDLQTILDVEIITSEAQVVV